MLYIYLKTAPGIIVLVAKLTFTSISLSLFFHGDILLLIPVISLKVWTMQSVFTLGLRSSSSVQPSFDWTKDQLSPDMIPIKLISQIILTLTPNVSDSNRSTSNNKSNVILDLKSGERRLQKSPGCLYFIYTTSYHWRKTRTRSFSDKWWWDCDLFWQIGVCDAVKGDQQGQLHEEAPAHSKWNNSGYGFVTLLHVGLLHLRVEAKYAKHSYAQTYTWLDKHFWKHTNVPVVR